MNPGEKELTEEDGGEPRDLRPFKIGTSSLFVRYYMTLLVPDSLSCLRQTYLVYVGEPDPQSLRRGTSPVPLLRLFYSPVTLKTPTTPNTPGLLPWG